MTTGVAIPGGSGPLSIRNLLCGGDVHGNALGRWSMLALPELPACCLVICLSHTATGRFLLRMSGARTDEPGVKRRGLRAGGLIGLAVGGKQGCDRYADTYFSDEWVSAQGLDPAGPAAALVEFERSCRWT